MGGLMFDTKSGLAAGGTSGPVIVSGKPKESRLLTALRFTARWDFTGYLRNRPWQTSCGGACLHQENAKDANI